MLVYNLDRILKTRGIDKPFAFLKNLGFVDSHAQRMKKEEIKAMQVGTIEKLCRALYCTPNDLMEWIPEKAHPIDAEHPLNKLKHQGKTIDVIKKLQSVPLEKLEEIEKLLDSDGQSEEA